MFKEKIFDILVHLAGIRIRSRKEVKTVKLSCSSVLLFFLFFSYVKRLLRFIVIGSGSAVDTDYGYVNEYLFTAAVRVTNENIGSTVIIRFDVGKKGS